MKANQGGRLWLKKETGAYKTSIFALTVLSVAVTLFSLSFAYLVRYLINSASNGQEQRLWIFSGLLIGLLLFKILGKTLENFYAEKLRAKMTTELRTKLFSKLLRSDYAKTYAYHSGELMNRLTTDIGEVSAYTVGLLPVIAGIVVQIIGSIIALITIDPLFTLIYVVAGTLFAVATSLFRKKLKQRQKEVLETDGAFRAYTQESLGSIMTIKAYGVEEKSAEKAAAFGEGYYQKRMARNRLRASMSGLFSLLSNFGLIFAIVWCSVGILIDETPDYGAMMAAVLLLMQLQSPLSSISTVAPAYYARLASGERLSEIDEIPVDNAIEDLENGQEVYNTLSEIRFEGIRFTYGRDIIFDGVNAAFKKGEIVCLTGPSGAGKSTVFKLLLAVFKPTDGEIYLDGEKLNAKHRGLFAYVPQGNFLFSGTIYENLTFFSMEKDSNLLNEKIEIALKAACCEFVYELPEGLSTQLTERGGGLSEGQLQRLAVARALLSERPILLLDEATSALDSETEKTLLENIKNLQNRTCLIVTHRPAALSIANRVLTVDNGKIL
ncbi:MAG: ABC transporter ATP-binding protein [Clostridia bacterium]|nr:ABC transporter ATP-binding protein [Clostridia bacterium]